MRNRYSFLSFTAFLFLVFLANPGLLSAQKKVTVQRLITTGRTTEVFHEVNDGTDLMLQKLRTDPRYKLAEDKMNQAILMASSDAAVLAADYTLPVVFHIISDDPAAVTDQQMIDALADLNQAFAKTGLYAGGDNPLTPGVDTRIQFCLAKKDPDGGNTTGITRTKSFFTDFDVDIEDGRMKNLVQWDPSKYVNIWYVAGLKSEIMPMFQCGAWIRLHEGGYATMPPGGGVTDGIVVTGFGALLAHEMGHYLGLYHTFEGLNCMNANCATQGDRVCDTPPDAVIGNSVACDQPDNSCNTDTVSGFTVNAPDMISNFMDYGNDNCHKSFTEGQAERMRAAIATQRSSLLLQNQCDQPCVENSVAAFTRNNPYPLPGNTVNFTNTSGGAANYQWMVDGTVMSAAANFSHLFTATGKYKVTLKAYNADVDCYSMYTDYVIVNCGVTARFYPDKRVIASKAGIFLDSIYFTNRSENAGSYRWLMGNDQGMAEQEISTDVNLKYVFTVPGRYSVRLIATNGSCTDTTETFRFNVEDPTADAQLHLQAVDCYQQNKIRMTLSVCNAGYASIPAGTPLTFYDSDPRLGNANKIGTFNLPDMLLGKCCSNLYTYILDVNRPGLNTIYAVFNDNGSTMPLVLPNTTLPEKIYTNNIAVRTQFQFKVAVLPATATLEPGDSLQLTSTAGPGSATYAWTPVQDMSCTDCDNPILVVTKDTIAKLVATSQYGCVDSAFSVIKAPPADDYTITINELECAAGSKLLAHFTVCNGFKRGIIPKALKVSFYEGDPSSAGSHLLSPVFVTAADSNQKCASFSHLFTQGSATTNIFAVVNDNGTAIPVQLPNTTFLEKNYANNTAVKSQVQFKATVLPATATLEPGDSLQLTSTAGPGPATYAWTPAGDLSCIDCDNPILVATKDTVATLVASNQYGCADTAFSVIKVPPADDYTISLNAIECARDNKLSASFTVCNNFKRGIIPKGLTVSFYDGDPAIVAAHLLSPVFITAADSSQSCALFGHLFAQRPPGKIFAVVNDNGTAIPLQLPNTNFKEKNYTNNETSLEYQPSYVLLKPADTTVFRKQSFAFGITSNISNPAGYQWSTGYGYNLSCTGCASPLITVLDNAVVKMQVTTRYGCIIPAEAQVKIFPPDMTVEILETACYTDKTTLVKFRINMNNGYDSVFKDLPVSFYNASPLTRDPGKLTPTFFTKQATAGSSAVFTQVIENPAAENIYAVVNDKSQALAAPPDIVFPETNYTNNIAVKQVIPFGLTISPADTSIQRSTPVQLQGHVAGGDASIILWEPSQGLSCTHCLNPVATPDASAKYKLTIQNEYSCIATAFATIKTYTARKINIPSAFTPNNDGLNDVFYIMAGKEVKQVANLAVFNRWGEKVFEVGNSPANDRNYGWNGFFKGKAAIAGTYVYLTTIEFADGSKEVFKGTITLIR